MTLWPTDGVFSAFQPWDVPAGFPFVTPQYRASRSPHRQALPADFPDYLVYVTRETLIGTTTSLSQASRGAHDYFRAVSNAIAYDRMMRTFFPWAAPSTAMWSCLNQAPLALPAPAQPPLLPYFGAGSSTPSRSVSVPGAVPPFYSAAMSVPPVAAAMTAGMAFMACTPALYETWRIAL